MNALVFQHLSVEHSGYFQNVMADLDISWTVIELDEGGVIPELETFDLLLVMGGPMDVWQDDTHPWLRVEKQAIRRWVRELKRPYLGICLGHLAGNGGDRVDLLACPRRGRRPLATDCAQNASRASAHAAECGGKST